MPRAVRFVAPAAPAARADGAVNESDDAVVYFPSCAARTMGAQRGDDGTEPLPTVAARLFAKAGLSVVYPGGLADLCCGQPFESKGQFAAAAAMAARLEAALAAASDGGRLPIVFDTSPCAYRMQKFLAGRLRVHDCVEFVHDRVLPHVALAPAAATVAIHPVCSVRRMGTADKFAAIAARCAARVVGVDAVLCCGFAGDKGFTEPELNAHALRDLAAALPADCTQGYASSRTCEIGLSERAGIPYRSILYLVDACASEIDG
jgi:D-lactate dehydrogenase